MVRVALPFTGQAAPPFAAGLVIVYLCMRFLVVQSQIPVTHVPAQLIGGLLLVFPAHVDYQPMVRYPDRCTPQQSNPRMYSSWKKRRIARRLFTLEYKCASLKKYNYNVLLKLTPGV
jgi:hypothetical protein